MDSAKESSSTCAMPTPPPPPPPMLNVNKMENERSQLLADIRKGATLKKTPTLLIDQNEQSPSDKLKKQTQDLLHAELTSTLKRRKPVVINEPPKYEYPTYDNSNKNDESSHSMNVNATNNSNNNNNVKKPLNVNAVLSVVSGIKIPDVQYDPNASKIQSNEKPMIMHARPNFTINTKENKPLNINEVTSPKVLIKSTESKLHRPSYFTNNLTTTTVDKSSAMPNAIDPNSESQVEKCKSIFLIKTQKSVEHDNGKLISQSQPKPKPQNLPQKTMLISKFEHMPVNQPQKEVLRKKLSIDELPNTNGISFANVANKKALFEKSVEQTAFINKPISNGKFSTLNSLRSINETNNNNQKSDVTTVKLNKNVIPTNGSLGRQISAKDRIDRHFKRSVHMVNETTSTNGNGKYETKQFEQKTFVSFSKDLHSAPNNYPDQIRVKKTIVTERSHAIQDNPFNNIRFSIKTDGQVIPKAK